MKFGTRVTITIVLCTVPLAVRDIVVNTRVISVICLPPATNEFGLHVDFVEGCRKELRQNPVVPEG